MMGTAGLDKADTSTVVRCQSVVDADGLFVDTTGATQVSVGIFIINVEHSRKKQMIATAESKAGIFFADFIIFIRQPPGAHLWTTDEEVWDTMSFRNAKEIFLSSNVPQVLGGRRIQGAFFYDPDLDMYPLDSQDLRIILQQTKFAANKWLFVEDSSLNGMSARIEDMKHKTCSTNPDFLNFNSTDFSAFTFTVTTRHPHWYAVITAFVPPVLFCLPAMLAYTLGPIAWYPLRFMLSGCSFISLVFFYDSYLRQLPVLDYLTLFDKYVYCLYLWILGGVIALMLMLWVFRDVVQDRNKNTVLGPKWQPGELADYERLYLSNHMRNDLLHLSMFCGIITLMGLAGAWLAWSVLPNVVVFIALLLIVWAYFWWLKLSYHRIKRKHVYEQDQAGGLMNVIANEENTVAKGRAFHFELLLCCCYPPVVDICIQECCCCFYKRHGV